MDEPRHVEAFSRYLHEKMQLAYPINTHLKSLLTDVITDSRWDMTYLGMQVLIEGLALAAFGLCIVFGLAFSWLFMTLGLLAGNAQAAYGPSLIATTILRRPFLPGDGGAWAEGRRAVLADALVRGAEAAVREPGALECVPATGPRSAQPSIAPEGPEASSDALYPGRARAKSAAPAVPVVSLLG